MNIRWPENGLPVLAPQDDFNPVTCADGTEDAFYVADYYKYWHDISDDEVLKYLKEWRMRRYDGNLDIPERKS